MRRRNMKWLLKVTFLSIVAITVFVAILSSISSSPATNRVSQSLQELNAKLKKDMAPLISGRDGRQIVSNEVENAQRNRIDGLLVANNGEKIDWHDYASMQKDTKRVGIGEGGRRAELDEATRVKEKLMSRQNGFNALLSDSISVNRSVPDIRNPGCKTKKYLKNLLTVSVVIPFYNEHFSVLMRSVHSIINRSPPDLIKEIILVDDFSDREYLGKQLEDYLATHFFSKAQIVRLHERTGLIGARMAGARKATGQVLIFLDSHVEANYNWLPPLLEPIAENPRTSVCPFIDVIDHANFEYRAQDEGARGAFDWEFYYKRLALLPEDLIDKTKPFRSPIMAGGLFAISSEFFWELGGYDEGLDIWGGEQYELSFKIWMCGGELVDAPCSRVGHIYRGPMDSKNPRKTDYVHKNYKRVAEVWMDEYKEYLYEHSPGVYDNVDPGDISKQKAIRKELKCKSFKWFMTEIAFDLIKSYPPVEPPDFASGTIRSVASPNLCLDNLNRPRHSMVGLYWCADNHQRPQANQFWGLSWHRDIRLRYKRDCLDVQTSEKDAPVWIWDCHGQGGNQYWYYDRETQWLRHGKESKNCLDSDPRKQRVFVNPCRKGNPNMQWTFGFVNNTALDSFFEDGPGL